MWSTYRVSNFAWSGAIVGEAEYLEFARSRHLMARYPSVPPEHLHHIFMKNDAFWIRLASDERLLALADAFAPFIDGSVALFSSHCIRTELVLPRVCLPSLLVMIRFSGCCLTDADFCKPPGSGKAVLWHQDGSYWPLRPMDVLTLYLAVDAANASNGGMRVVPGSHRWPLGVLRNSTRDGSDVLGSATHDEAEMDGALIRDLELRPGDVEIRTLTAWLSLT